MLQDLSRLYQQETAPFRQTIFLNVVVLGSCACHSRDGLAKLGQRRDLELLRRKGTKTACIVPNVYPAAGALRKVLCATAPVHPPRMRPPAWARNQQKVQDALSRGFYSYPDKGPHWN